MSERRAGYTVETVCAQCSAVFWAARMRPERQQRFCSNSCSVKSRGWVPSPNWPPDIERFWARVDKTGPCWLWTGAKVRSGYGTMLFNGKPTRTHRISFYLHHGWMPAYVLHTCDTPSCVNPAHLKAGNHSENMKDMHAKRRHRFSPH